MALILYTKKLDESSIKDPVALPPEDPRNIGSTIAKLPAKPTKELVAAKKSQFLSRKSDHRHTNQSHEKKTIVQTKFTFSHCPFQVMSK